MLHLVQYWSYKKLSEIKLFFPEASRPALIGPIDDDDDDDEEEGGELRCVDTVPSVTRGPV